jgi:hypothetical protein
VLVALLLYTLGWSVLTVPAVLTLLAVLLAEWLGSTDSAPLDLAGKNVWITGAGSGIGEALVRPPAAPEPAPAEMRGGRARA